jgi:hypothetical protein
MIKHGIDQEALIKQFSEASAKQGAAVRKAVTEVTLKALQGRELTLANIKQVLGTVAKAASTGAANNPLAPANAETLLASATAGMDAALATAVQANRKALQQMIDQGASLRETQAKKALALEVAKKGVTVNTISPGYIGTKMVTAIPKDVLDSKILPHIPVGRLGRPEEVAGLIIYLASEEAAFVTGANIAINGGQHMQ